MDDQAAHDKAEGVKRVRCPHCEHPNRILAKFVAMISGGLTFTCQGCKKEFEIEA